MSTELFHEFVAVFVPSEADFSLPLIPLSRPQVSPLAVNMSESVCSLKFAQRVRSVELSSLTSSFRRHENSSTSSSPTHDSVEVTDDLRHVHDVT